MELKKTVLSLGTALAFSLPTPSNGADNRSLEDTITTTPDDPDGDGLPTAYELGLLPPFGPTDPNNADSDGDDQRDGVEDKNRSHDGNADNADNPDLGNWLYDFTKIKSITSGTLEHSMFPFFVGAKGFKVGYVTHDLNYSLGSSFLKNIKQMATERTQLTSDVEGVLRAIDATALGNLMYIGKDDGAIYKKQLRDQVIGNAETRAIPGQAQPLLNSHSNPAFYGRVDVSGATPEENSERFVVATQDGQLFAFQLRTDGPATNNWDASTTPIQITNFINPVDFAKVESESGKIMFQERNDTTGKTQIWIFDGLDEIIGQSGNTDPYTPTGDTRGEAVTFFAGGVALPGGFAGVKGDFAIFSQDENDVARFYESNSSLDELTTGSLTDWDVYVLPLNVPSSKQSMPYTGNQIVTDAHVGRLLLMSDSFDNSNGVFNVYMAGFSPRAKMINGVNMDIYNGFLGSNGVEWRNNRSEESMNLTGAQSSAVASTYTLVLYSPIDDLQPDNLAGSALASQLRFGPSGMTIDGDGTTTPGMRTITKFSNLGLVVETNGVADGVIDPNTITLAHYNPTTGEPEPIDPSMIQNIDLSNQEIDAILDEFSDWGVVGSVKPKPGEPSSVDPQLIFLYR